MGMLHRALQYSYAPLVGLNRMRHSFANPGAPPLRVLIYHDIAKDDLPHFASQIHWLRHRWNFASPAEFVELLEGKAKASQPTLLLTFDDGFASSREAADDVLDPLGIKALFFVVSEFVDGKFGDQFREYVARRIRPGAAPAEVSDACQNMTWADLRQLARSGHAIGAHTMTHARLSAVHDPEVLATEIATAGDVIEQSLGAAVEHFAYTFGDLGSFSQEALRASRARYRYVHSGIRGNNVGRPPWAICRDAISPRDHNHLVGSLLEGGADVLYAGSRKRLLSWGSQYSAARS